MFVSFSIIVCAKIENDLPTTIDVTRFASCSGNAKREGHFWSITTQQPGIGTLNVIFTVQTAHVVCVRNNYPTHM